MSNHFEHEAAMATSEAAIPNEGWATPDFASEPPIKAEMEITQFPWETTPDFQATPSALVSPSNVIVITAPPEKVQEAARKYVARIGPALPASVRDSFAKGAGMFDFPAPPNIDDQLA